MSGLFCASLAACIPNVTFLSGPVYTPVEKVFEKKGQKQESI